MTNPFNRQQPLFVTILLIILPFSLPTVFAAAPPIGSVSSYGMIKRTDMVGR